MQLVASCAFSSLWSSTCFGVDNLAFPDLKSLNDKKGEACWGGDFEDDEAFWSCGWLPLLLQDATCRQSKGDSKLSIIFDRHVVTRLDFRIQIAFPCQRLTTWHHNTHLKKKKYPHICMVQIDNSVFRLHYDFTVGFFFLATGLLRFI